MASRRAAARPGDPAEPPRAASVATAAKVTGSARVGSRHGLPGARRRRARRRTALGPPGLGHDRCMTPPAPGVASPATGPAGPPPVAQGPTRGHRGGAGRERSKAVVTRPAPARGRSGSGRCRPARGSASELDPASGSGTSLPDTVSDGRLPGKIGVRAGLDPFGFRDGRCAPSPGPGASSLSMASPGSSPQGRRRVRCRRAGLATRCRRCIAWPSGSPRYNRCPMPAARSRLDPPPVGLALGAMPGPRQRCRAGRRGRWTRPVPPPRPQVEPLAAGLGLDARCGPRDRGRAYPRRRLGRPLASPTGRDR